MKKVIFGVIVLFTLICSSACENEPEINEILGEWKLYRTETLETVLLEWDVDNETWITGEEWYQTTFDWEVFLVFNEDGTFESLYANVPTGEGTWEDEGDGTYYLEYADGRGYSINLWCENTQSQQAEDNDRVVEYYRKRDTVECTDLIDYNVE